MFGHLALLQTFINSSDVLSEGGVIVILDAIVRSKLKVSIKMKIDFYLPSFEKFCNISPFVAVYFVSIENYYFFFTVDRGFFDVGVQVVVPSFSALLSSPAPDHVIFLEHLGNVRPFLGAMLFYQFNDGVVLL